MLIYGADIGGTSVKAGRVENGAVTARASAPSPRDPAEMAKTVRLLLEQLGRKGADAPIGIACAGSVSDDGIVMADNLGWQYGAPLGRLLEEELKQKATVLNDAYAALLAEWKIGALKDVQHGVLLTFGTGIGSGVIANGKPFRGRGNIGVELGHIITHADGLPCACGQFGCYELYSSASALKRMSGMSAREAMDKAKAGELKEIFAQYLNEVRIGLLSILAAFAPEKMVFGGGLSEAGDFFLNSVVGAVKATPGYERMYGGVEFALSAHGNDAGLLGAAQAAYEAKK